MLLLVFLAGCGSSSQGPSAGSYGSTPSTTIYMVQSGDTLYSIAFRYGLDYRKVAEVNRIVPPYTIYPGQHIYLWQVTPAAANTAPAPIARVPAAPAPAPAPVAPPPAATASGVIVTAVPGIGNVPVTQAPRAPSPVYQGVPPIGAAATPEVVVAGAATPPPPAVPLPTAAPAPVATAPGPAAIPASEAAPAPVAPPVPVVTPAPAVPATATAAPEPVPAAVPQPVVEPTVEPSPPPTPAPVVSQPPVPGAKVTAWRWPAAGPITRGYSSSVHKGIDIGGDRGDPIYAVADGTVVYAGTGIVGFGELVIIKHNEIYISAYGHNDTLLVKENDVVGAGQLIAEKGSSGTDTVKLHFEIRKEGKPIDPLQLLPKR